MKAKRIEAYWNNFFGIEEEHLRLGTVIVPHNQLGAYKGIWIFDRGYQTIISTPPELLEKIISRFNVHTYHNLDYFSSQSLEDLFSIKIDRIIGPTYQGYYDDYQIKFETGRNIKRINYHEHLDSITALSHSGDAQDWENSGVKISNQGLYGYFYKDQLVSVACYDIIERDVAFIGIFTHPEWRGKGFSFEVVSKLVQDVSADGKIIRFQTLESNPASIKVAKRIGFKSYARNIAIRFLNDER